MPDPSNSSFIPKRGPTKKRRTTATKKVYIFTVISYVLLFSALLASGGVYFYKGEVQKDLKEEVTLLNTQISTFSEKDMERVLEFNNRLEQAQSRLEIAVSVPSLFSALEESTARTVKITSLELEREEDDKLVLSGEMETDTFDSALFQRRIYQNNQTIESVEITEFNATAVDGNPDNRGDGPFTPTFSFSVMLDFPLSEIPTTVSRDTIPDSSTDSTSATPPAPTGTMSDSAEDLPADNSITL